MQGIPSRSKQSKKYTTTSEFKNILSENSIKYPARCVLGPQGHQISALKQLSSSFLHFVKYFNERFIASSRYHIYDNATTLPVDGYSPAARNQFVIHKVGSCNKCQYVWGEGDIKANMLTLFEVQSKTNCSTFMDRTKFL